MENNFLLVQIIVPPVLYFLATVFAFAICKHKKVPHQFLFFMVFLLLFKVAGLFQLEGPEIPPRYTTYVTAILVSFGIIINFQKTRENEFKEKVIFITSYSIICVAAYGTLSFIQFYLSQYNFL